MGRIERGWAALTMLFSLIAAQLLAEMSDFILGGLPRGSLGFVGGGSSSGGG